MVGARDWSPVRKLSEIPTPANHASGNSGLRVRISRSCFGKPRPTRTSVGRAARSSVLDPVQLPRIVLESEGRAVGADVLKPRIQCLEPASRVRGHAGVSTEQEDAYPGAGGGLRQAEDEIAAGNPLRHRCTGQPRGPDDRLAIRHPMAGSQDQLSAPGDPL